MQINGNYLEIYFDDLSEVAQEEFIEIMGENGNYDVFPMIELPIDGFIDNEYPKYYELTLTDEFSDTYGAPIVRITDEEMEDDLLCELNGSLSYTFELLTTDGISIDSSWILNAEELIGYEEEDMR